MKGIFIDKNYRASIGCPREKEDSMFAIGGLLAFKQHYWASAGGKDGRVEICPTSDPYFLQEEISLEEYDKSQGNNNDIQTVVTLKEAHLIYRQAWGRGFSYTYYYALGITNSPDVLLPDRIITKKRIEEVRNHPGKWLHVYELEESYGKFARENKSNSFMELIGVLKNSQIKTKVEEETEEKKTFAREKAEQLVQMGFSKKNAWEIIHAAGPGRCLTAVDWAREALQSVNGSFDVLDTILNGIGGTNGFGKDRILGVFKVLRLPIPYASNARGLYAIIRGAKVAMWCLPKPQPVKVPLQENEAA